MKLQSTGRSRRGATLVETALVMTVFLTLVLGMLDLAGAVYRHNTLSAAARQGAREAIVHGSQAPPRRDAWGPSSYHGHAADSSEIAAAIRPLLAGMDAADVTITLEWPDGTNAAPNRVRCMVSTDYRPMTTLLLGGQTIELRAASVMLIAN